MRVIAISDQHSVLGVNDNQIFHANSRNYSIPTLNKAIGRADHDRFTLNAISTLVRLIQFADRFPRPNVTPTEITGHHCGVISTFHYRIINGD